MALTTRWMVLANCKLRQEYSEHLDTSCASCAIHAVFKFYLKLTAMLISLFPGLLFILSNALITMEWMREEEQAKMVQSGVVYKTGMKQKADIWKSEWYMYYHSSLALSYTDVLLLRSGFSGKPLHTKILAITPYVGHVMWNYGIFTKCIPYLHPSE